MKKRFEVISNPSQKGLERREVPRLSLTSEQFKLASSKKVYSVHDLSCSGMALHLIEENDRSQFPVGERVRGEININRQKYAVEATVRNHRDGLVGVEFQGLTQSVKKAIKTLLSPCSLGRSLKMIPAHQVGYFWFHGPSGTDLVLYKGEAQSVQKFVLYVLGSFIQWENSQGVQTGRLIYQSQDGASVIPVSNEIQGIVELESTILQTDPLPDPKKIKIALEVIGSSKIPEELKTLVTERLG